MSDEDKEYVAQNNTLGGSQIFNSNFQSGWRPGEYNISTPNTANLNSISMDMLPQSGGGPTVTELDAAKKAADKLSGGTNSMDELLKKLNSMQDGYMKKSDNPFVGLDGGMTSYGQWQTGIGIGQLGLGLASYLDASKTAKKNRELLSQQLETNRYLLDRTKAKDEALQSTFGKPVATPKTTL